MKEEVRLRLSKARGFLTQAEAIDLSAGPEASIHLCYYAMYHAAVAVLTDRTGTAPAKHTGIIGQFGLLVRDMGDSARLAGRALNLAYDTRVLADYDVGQTDLTQDAERLRVDARSFLQFCETLVPQAPSSGP